MKFIWFKGDLGNQVFSCAFYNYLKKKFPHEKIYGCMKTSVPIVVNKYFDLELPESYKYLDNLLFVIFRISKKLHIKWGMSTDVYFKEDALFYNGYWQNNKFYDRDNSWLKMKLPKDIGSKNLAILEDMKKTNSVSIHIRRGDYLKYKKIYGIDTDTYYKNAIVKIKQIIENPVFFYFSNDMEWVRENMGDKNRDYYIDWNVGERSFLDMYLMSKAKANIIANSTFSYWAAYLNENNAIVIYPKEWYNKNCTEKSPAIFDENWIAI